VTLGSGVEGGSTTEDIFEEDTSDDYLEDEVMITETATHRPEEETLAGVSLPETSTAEGDIDDSRASEELKTLRPETFEEHLTTTENIYEETSTAQTTTTIPDEEKQTNQTTIIDEEGQFEYPEEQTTAASEGTTSTEELKIANEVTELMEEEEKEVKYLSTTEEVPFENPSTMKPLTETVAPVTTDSSAEDPKTTFLDDYVITDRPAIEEEGSADTDETLINTTEVNVEDFKKEPETSTARPEEEQSTTSRVDSESTSRANQPEDIRDDMTTEQPSKVIMTHMYVMQERKNSTLEESNNLSNEIQANIQPEMSSVSTSNPLDQLVATESINDNIIFDTSEIFPVKAPQEEEEVTEGRKNIDAVSRVEDPESSLEKIGDHYGTSYRTEKSISRVVTEVSV